MPKGPVKGTQIKDGRYYLVRAEGAKRRWVPLTRVRDGLPALYLMLAQLQSDGVADDRMASLIVDWQKAVMVGHAHSTQVNEIARCKVIAEAFQEFRAGQLMAPDAAKFLKQFRDRPRTHNLYRALLRELMRFAIEKGYRTENPIESLRTMAEPARSRYITDSELRRLKIGCLYGDDGKRTRSGLTMACLIELAYLTGADIGVLLELRMQRDPQQPDAPHLRDDGIWLRRTKTTTSRPVLVEWTPRLRAVVQRLLAIKAERKLKKRLQQRVVTPYLLESVDGSQLTYEAASAAWQRGRTRSQVAPCMFRDLRAKAGTDKEEAEGIKAANALLDHTTETQTADYIRRKKARRSTAVR